MITGMHFLQPTTNALKRWRGRLAMLFASLLLVSCGGSIRVIHGQSPGPNAVSTTSLASRIDQIVNTPDLGSCFIGIKIRSLADGTVLYEQNANKLFHPASNMKLLTTATALHALPVDFQFRTQLFSDASISNGVLRGDLYVRGAGDPLLRSSDLDSVAEQLRMAGIRSVSGDLIGDVSSMDTVFWGAGWMWDDEPYAEQAFHTPLTVNANSVTVLVSPGETVGRPARVVIDPPTPSFQIVNTAVTSIDTLLPLLDVTRVSRENMIVVSGRVAPGVAERKFMLSIWRPELYFLSLLREKLTERGIEVKGETQLGTYGGNRSLAEVSHPLDSVVIQINKQSDNLAAELLLKTIGSVKAGIPGSAGTGLAAVKEYLTGIGLDTSQMILKDGSGVSWYNGLTPDQLLTILTNEYREKATFPRFFASLPIAGVDGTLKSRMIGTRAEGNVHAKTGTLTGVSSLSGYVTTADGVMLAFSIMCNHYPGQIAALRSAQNQIMELLASEKVTKP